VSEKADTGKAGTGKAVAGKADTHKAGTGKAGTGKAETGSAKLRVLVCDDNALFRRGLKMVLDEEPDLELVGEASDGAEVVVRAQELMPDVILMDVRMPKRSGIEAAGEIKDSLPHVKILMPTISDDVTDLYGRNKAGASGYEGAANRWHRGDESSRPIELSGIHRFLHLGGDYGPDVLEALESVCAY